MPTPDVIRPATEKPTLAQLSLLFPDLSTEHIDYCQRNMPFNWDLFTRDRMRDTGFERVHVGSRIENGRGYPYFLYPDSAWLTNDLTVYNGVPWVRIERVHALRQNEEEQWEIGRGQTFIWDLYGQTVYMPGKGGTFKSTYRCCPRNETEQSEQVLFTEFYKTDPNVVIQFDNRALTLVDDSGYSITIGGIPLCTGSTICDPPPVQINGKQYGKGYIDKRTAQMHIS